MLKSDIKLQKEKDRKTLRVKENLVKIYRQQVKTFKHNKDKTFSGILQAVWFQVDKYIYIYIEILYMYINVLI